MSNYVHNDVPWAENLQKDLTEYMGGLWDGVWDDREPKGTVSGEPFCGCDTCETREYIMFLIPRIIDAYKAGVIVED